MNRFSLSQAIVFGQLGSLKLGDPIEDAIELLGPDFDTAKGTGKTRLYRFSDGLYEAASHQERIIFLEICYSKICQGRRGDAGASSVKANVESLVVDADIATRGAAIAWLESVGLPFLDQTGEGGTLIVDDRVDLEFFDDELHSIQMSAFRSKANRE